MKNEGEGIKDFFGYLPYKSVVKRIYGEFMRSDTKLDLCKIGQMILAGVSGKIRA
jgi:hypothetical protein